MMPHPLHWAIALKAFSRPSLLDFVMRFVRKDRFEKYRGAFLRHGGWMLFLARFTFGIRALAYLAAGAARYPLRRFLLIDGMSVAIQVLFFVGIGSYAGKNIKWEKATAHDITILIMGAAVLSVLFSLGATFLVKRFTRGNS